MERDCNRKGKQKNYFRQNKFLKYIIITFISNYNLNPVNFWLMIKNVIFLPLIDIITNYTRLFIKITTISYFHNNAKITT
jgi:hypothetical protein